MDEGMVRDNVLRAREEIQRIQCAEGLDHPVRIVAVTKGHPVAAVRAAIAAGLTDVGENRVQEAVAKWRTEATWPIRWHLIGHLQTNKAKLVPGVFSMVQSVDSSKVADALAQAHARADVATPLDVLIQVNVAGETQKSGCAPADVERLVATVTGHDALQLRGFMTMAPLTEDERRQREIFAGLRAVRDRVAASGPPLPELSMGMSGDYRAAVAEGATLVRLGTILFGERA